VAGALRRPERICLKGQYVTVAPLDPAAHGEDLWEGVGGEAHAPLWLYMPDGPYPDRAAFDASLRAKAASEDPLYYAILDGESGRALGHASYLRIEPKHRVIEVGGLMYSPALQRTRGATEAMYLMARYAFEDLGARRYEWKCNALNEPSRRAALRLGFTMEGIFRQHMLVKGVNRDTAWYSMLDSEWPARGRRFERWLSPSNFSPEGRQISSLDSMGR
jgi:RimJ/RimL family protein N-acetyltransferase